MKCKYCGETMESYVGYCPSCGKENKESVDSSSEINELIIKLEAINREYEGLLIELENKKRELSSDDEDFDDDLQEAKKTYEQKKIRLIRSFTVPNNIDGICEFMMLVASNFDPIYHAQHLNKSDISDVWLLKMEQAYQKADLMFAGHPSFLKIQKIYEKFTKSKDDAIRKKRAGRRIWTFSIIGLALLVAVIVSIVLPPALRGRRIGRNSEAFIGEDVIISMEYFKSRGFKNVVAVGMRDDVEDRNAGEVIEVKIDGNLDFDSGDRYKRKAVIEIKYIIKTVVVSESAKALKGKNYEDVVAILQNMGFTNIQTVEDKDVTIGLIYNVGDVKSVSINGDKNFDEGDKFDSDVVIVITYHGQKTW